MRDSYWANSPSGSLTLIKIHKSGCRSGPKGRHRFGIRRAALNPVNKVNEFIFWAQGENVILCVPWEFLRSVYKNCDGLQITQSDQWVVNIYYDYKLLCPVNARQDVPVAQFVHALHV